VRVRVACWNVQGLRAGVDAVVRAIEPAAPDVLILQECGSRRAVHSLARSLGLEAVSSSRLFGAVHNAVLFRDPWRLSSVDVADLAREGRTSARGFLVARLRRAGFHGAFVSSHLGLSDRERERHARELTDAVGGIAEPVVMGVDLNEGPDGRAARWISARLYDAFAVAPDGPGETFPSRSPTDRIDYVFVGEGVGVKRAWVVGTALAGLASDHRPVAADLDLPH
jgi:endonuclease/exonuclease/phosphatase family metal-dependent hydrolase